MTPEQAATLRWFKWTEWRHPARVDYAAAKLLDDVREAYGLPLVLTSDARTEEENREAGGSPTSHHLAGRAFDLRWPADPFRFVEAVVRARGERPVELELVYGPQDKHIHLALLPADRTSRLVLALD